MNSLLRNPVALATTKKMFGGQTLSVVRNAGGPALPPGSGGIPFPPGPKQMQQVRNWVASSMIFGATGVVGIVYFTDWRVITDWIPFYNGKYKEQ